MAKLTLSVIQFILLFVLPKTILFGDCDSAGWASCNELTGESFNDCSIIACERDIIGYDPETAAPIFGAQYCPRFARVPPTGTTALTGDVRVRIQGEGAAEGFFSSWTEGQTVVCAVDYVCEGCTAPEAFEFTTYCVTTATSIRKCLRTPSA
jgi:hypothetical protein